MWWSHADRATYRTWIEQAGLSVVAQGVIPEGDGMHALFWARRPLDQLSIACDSASPRPGCTAHSLSPAGKSA
jgi:hypothetical protein